MIDGTNMGGKVNKVTADLNKDINHLDLTDIHRTLCPKIEEIFPSIHRMFTKIEYSLKNF